MRSLDRAQYILAARKALGSDGVAYQTSGGRVGLQLLQHLAQLLHHLRACRLGCQTWQRDWHTGKS